MSGRGLLLFTFGLPLLQVVIPAMTMQSHSLRLEVAAVQQQFHLRRASPLRAYSRKRLRAPTCAQPRLNEQALTAEHLPFERVWDPFPYMLPKDFVQSIGRVSPVLRSSIVSRNKSGAAKPR
jgi:hypothetical protein